MMEDRMAGQPAILARAMTPAAAAFGFHVKEC